MMEETNASEASPAVQRTNSGLSGTPRTHKRSSSHTATWHSPISTSSSIALKKANRILAGISIPQKDKWSDRLSYGELHNLRSGAPQSLRKGSYQPASSFRAPRQKPSDDMTQPQDGKTESHGARNLVHDEPASFFQKRFARQKACGPSTELQDAKHRPWSACQTASLFGDPQQDSQDEGISTKSQDARHRPWSAPSAASATGVGQCVIEQITEMVIKEMKCQEEMKCQQQMENQEIQSKIATLEEKCQKFEANSYNWQQMWMQSEEERLKCQEEMKYQQQMENQECESKIVTLEEKCQKFEANSHSWHQMWMQSEDEKLQLQKELHASKQVLQENQSKGFCVVCLDQQASHAMLPCGHLALCEDCSKDPGRFSECLICRQEVHSLVRIFQS